MGLHDGGVRTMQTGYDRVFGFGDINTWINLVGVVEITINALDLCCRDGRGLDRAHKRELWIIVANQPLTGTSLSG